MKYITYKKRTEQEVRKKFKNEIDEQLLDEIIEYLKEANYLDDYQFIQKQVNEYLQPALELYFQNAGINVVDIKFGDKKLRIIGNGIVNIHSVLPNVDLSSLHIKEYVNYEVLKNINMTSQGIGFGTGYIELSNGYFSVDNSMN